MAPASSRYAASHLAIPQPENVLFTDDMSLRIADFGLAIDLKEERAVTRVGECCWRAPAMGCVHSVTEQQCLDQPSSPKAALSNRNEQTPLNSNPENIPGTLDYMAPEVLKCPLKRLPNDNKEKPVRPFIHPLHDGARLLASAGNPAWGCT